MGLHTPKKEKSEIIVALSGNPNVGKSTVFNALTGLHQHTGNWPGKTVTNARGQYEYKGKSYILVDIPGTYSLMAASGEEEVARDFLCFGQPDVTVIVTDATCLERNLNLVLQILEVTSKVVLCVNLMDEAKKKNISVDLNALSEKLDIAVVGTSARSKKGLDRLMEAVELVSTLPEGSVPIKYSEKIEKAISFLEPAVIKRLGCKANSRWISLKLLEKDQSMLSSIGNFLGSDFLKDEEIKEGMEEAERFLKEKGISYEELKDEMVSGIIGVCEKIADEVISVEKKDYNQRDRKIDKILTSRITGLPIMIALLFVVFWITITGAEYPSEWIAKGLFWVENRLVELFFNLSIPDRITELLVFGVYRTLAWVVSVMLPPMAIFFPLFTLLEDSGYLPRIAFNLDHFFRKACTHGKQALTMCMGFGCNAAGVIGCRIIDSPRERFIAIITNSFVPCNGRFPTLIAIITMFFTGAVIGVFESVISALALIGVIVLSVAMTLLISKVLSKTVLKGLPSSFHLELPPYRKPLIGKVLLRSVLDRTLFVLGRAVVIAAPAGLVIWILANVQIEGISLLSHCAGFLDPFARLLGLDGTILMAFILGFPANEIVIPIIIMSYMAKGSLTEIGNLTELRSLLTDNGWTWLTAVCVMLFSLMHWPCGTTCLTIKKETKSWKWTIVSIAIPTITGLLLCFIVTSLVHILGL